MSRSMSRYLYKVILQRLSMDRSGNTESRRTECWVYAAHVHEVRSLISSQYHVMTYESIQRYAQARLVSVVQDSHTSS